MNHPDFFSVLKAHNWTLSDAPQHCPHVYIAESPCKKYIALFSSYFYSTTPLANFCIITAERYAEVRIEWETYAKAYVAKYGIRPARSIIDLARKGDIVRGFTDSTIGEVNMFLRMAAED